LVNNIGEVFLGCLRQVLVFICFVMLGSCRTSPSMR